MLIIHMDIIFFLLLVLNLVKPIAKYSIPAEKTTIFAKIYYKFVPQ